MASTTVFRSRYVMANGVRTHYTEVGDNGIPVVLLHGSGAGSSGEAGFARVLPLMAPHFRAIALDSIGGWGDTDVRAVAKHGIESRARHLADFIDALGLEKVHLVGNSQGAWVAARYAIQNPDRVGKMVLVATATVAWAMGIAMPETPGMRVLLSYDGTRGSMRKTLEAIIHDKSMITDQLVETRLAAANRPGAAEARKAFNEGNRRFMEDPGLRLNFDMRHTLPKLPNPTIMIWGEQDDFASPEGGRQLEKVLPNVKFHWVKDAGHQVQTDKPREFARIVVDFLK
ncbi:MAG: alpha/beta fold hydrolase [SAR202 cluster bacterium]|nr:alpha/beta fold hydrolase [SAR202 cluster bacterium]